MNGTICNSQEGYGHPLNVIFINLEEDIFILSDWKMEELSLASCNRRQNAKFIFRKNVETNSLDLYETKRFLLFVYNKYRIGILAFIRVLLLKGVDL